MRWMILAVPALCLLMGCQQDNNEEVLRKLADLEARQKQGSDDAFTKWLMTQGKAGDTADIDRRLNTFRDDITAQLEKLSKSIRDSGAENKSQIADLDSRIQKIGNIESSLASLKTMVESLEGKVKAVDPNEALKLHKDLYAKEFELQSEQKAHQEALKTIEGLKTQLANVQKELQDAKEQMVGLTEADISKHPQYRELKRTLTEAEAERDRARSDLDAKIKQYDALVEQLRAGGSQPKEATPAPLTGEFDFVGEVDSIKLEQGTGQSLMIVNVKRGRVPPVNAEVMVLDARNNRLCTAKVVSFYHAGDNPELPVESVGCKTLDQKATKPPNKGDTVVWKEARDESPSGAAVPGNPAGAAGGD
jgi:myosin heavy subunit